MTFSLIVAVSKNNVIGINGAIPWDSPGDRKLFKTLTMGKKIVYGRKTHGANFPLKGRTNLILSTTLESSAETQVYNNIPDLLKDHDSDEEIMVVGGASVYEQFISGLLVDKIYMSVINTEVMGGTKFPFKVDIFKKFATFGSEIEYKIVETIVYSDFTFYEMRYMNPAEQLALIKYEDLVHRNNSFDKISRAGACTSIFTNNEIVIDVRYTFPLMSFRTQFFRGMVEEVLFYISGETNTKILEEKNVNVWRENTSREFLDKNGFPDYKEGEMGPGYGWQFRRAGANYPDRAGGVDQLAELIETIKRDPNSRRLIISLWDVKSISKMVLPPCLNYYQFMVVDGYLWVYAHMRSSDFALAGNWNIASTALLLYLVAHATGLKPGFVRWNAVDLHLYENQREGLRQVLDHDCLGTFPRLYVDAPTDIEQVRFEHLRLVGYNCIKKVKLAMNA